MTFLQDLGAFLLAIWRKWIYWGTSSILVIVVGAIEHFSGRSISWGLYEWFFGLSLAFAIFQTWRDQYRRAIALERNLRTPPEVRTRLQALYDEGVEIRQQIIADTHEEPWAPLTTEPNGWFVRFRNYVYTALGPMVARAIDDLSVSTALPPYPGAGSWSSRKCDAIRHLDIRMDFLQQLMSRR